MATKRLQIIGNFGSGGSVELDTTLTQAGKAADAAAVGTALGDIEAALDSIIAIQEELIGSSSEGDSSDTTYYCSACGAEITTDTAQVGCCSECGARCIVCPDCGAIHASEGPYECVNCGRDLEELV